MKEKEYYLLLLNKANELIMYYDILKTKELENRKGDLEYNNALFQIVRLRKEEDKLYEKLFSGVNTKDEIIELSSTIAGIAIGELSNNFDLSNKKAILEPISVIFGNKLPNEVLVAMRITTKLLEISKKKCMHELLTERYGEDNEEELDTYDTYSSLESRVDKQFLDIIDSHIEEARDFEEIRRMYIDAKYSYAFVRSEESEIYIDEDDYSKKMIYSVATIPKILEYAIKLSELNKPTLTHKSNQRRLMLESDYVRALVLQLDDLSFDTLLSIIKEETKKGNIGNDFGMQVFNNILSFRDEDIEKFNNDNLELKRLF
ncbi:MAG: hypothetical protein ACI33S_02615 [Bacilli bacterium]